MANTSQLTPDSQFPADALRQSVTVQPVAEIPANGGQIFTWNIASASDEILPWGKNVPRRDQQLRDFWPTEPYLAGGILSMSSKYSTFNWEVKAPSERVAQAVTDMLNAALAGDKFGWLPFMQKFSQDGFTQDNGMFIELIRDPVLDAGSIFKNERAPVLGIGHLDAGKCTRTGRVDYPVIYLDRQGERHKLAWYEVIPFSDFPSPIETMNGVGHCPVTRVLRMSQTIRSILVLMNEKASGRYYRQIHFVSGISRTDIEDQKKRGQEEANNIGATRYIQPAILASLDPEKPVSTATIDLSSLPDGFNFDEMMRWYISAMALDFGVDYQEFAPLPGGNIGSSAQSMILHRKASGKSPAVFMRSISEAFKNYGVMPRNCELTWQDRDEQEELERAEVRKAVIEGEALALRNGIVDPNASRQYLKGRGIYDKAILDGIDKEYGLQLLMKGTGSGFGGGATSTPNPLGQVGGNTMAQDIGRQSTGEQNLTTGNQLLK